MPQPISFFLPLAFSTRLDPLANALAGTQEPKQAPDAPAGASPNAPGPQQPGSAPVPGAPQTPAGGAAPDQCGGTNMLLYMGVFVALMYFMVMRPEQKRRKEQQSMLSAVKQGDHVVTVGGMHGTIVKLTDKTVTVRIDTVNITFDRVAIARVERDDAAAPPAKA